MEAEVVEPEVEGPNTREALWSACMNYISFCHPDGMDYDFGTEAELLRAAADMSEEILAAISCPDCGKVSPIWMVHDEIWAESGLATNDGMFCRTCFEQRLGREITIADLTDAPANAPLRHMMETGETLTPEMYREMMMDAVMEQRESAP